MNNLIKQVSSVGGYISESQSQNHDRDNSPVERKPRRSMTSNSLGRAHNLQPSFSNTIDFQHTGSMRRNSKNRPSFTLADCSVTSADIQCERAESEHSDHSDISGLVLPRNASKRSMS
jgi:hypothetical protein